MAKYKEWLIDSNLLTIEGWAREGLNDEEIAKKIGINKSTFYDWVRRFPPFSDSIKKGRYPVIIDAESTFFEKKLKGYFVNEEVTEKTVQRNAQGDIIGTTEHKRVSSRFIPPDTTAMIFYLKCRKGEVYNDKLNVNVDVSKEGKLADLIDGLKEPFDDLHEETKAADVSVADESAQKNKPT